MTDFNYHPTPGYRFFLYDPEGDGVRYYRTAEERDADAADAIQGYLDEGWNTDVTNVVAGEVTHHVVARNVELRPQREEFDNDEDYEQALSEGGFDGDEFSHCCNYVLAPIDDPGETTP